MKELVELFSDPGETVVDPFCGSASTGLACMQASGGPRNFIGVELDVAYHKLSERRMRLNDHGRSFRGDRVASIRGQAQLFGGDL
jgi:DNA modification methylase